MGKTKKDLKKEAQKKPQQGPDDRHIIGDCQCGQGQCFYWSDGSTSCGMELIN